MEVSHESEHTIAQYVRTHTHTHMHTHNGTCMHIQTHSKWYWLHCSGGCMVISRWGTGLSDYWPGSTLLGKLHSYQRCRKKQFTFPTITNIYTICTAYVRAMEKASHAQAGTVLYINFYTLILGG